MIQKYFDKLFERIKRLFDKDAEKKEIYPERDWFYIITIFIVFSFALTIFYYYKLGKDVILQDNIAVSQNVLIPELSIEKIKKENFKKMIAVWEAKQKKFNDYILTPPNFDSLR